LINKFQEINVAIWNNSQVLKKVSRTLGTIDKYLLKKLKKFPNFLNLYLTSPLVEAKNADKQF
jgi:hypothetical protein